MSALNKMVELVAAIGMVQSDNAALADQMKDGKDSVTNLVRETATECHDEGMSPLESYAAFLGYLAQRQAMNPNAPKVNKIYSTGLKGYVTMLADNVNIEQFTDKGKPAPIQSAVAYIASNDVKRIQAAKARIAEVIKACTNKDKAIEAAALEALASDIEALGVADAPVTTLAEAA